MDEGFACGLAKSLSRVSLQAFMYIKHVTPINFGPFCSPTTLSLEKDLTVITGRNDVGKSSVLRLLDLICSSEDSNAVTQKDANISLLTQYSKPWNETRDFGAKVTLVSDSTSPEPLSRLPIGEEYSTKFYFAPSQTGKAAVRKHDSIPKTHRSASYNLTLGRMPNSQMFGDERILRSVLNLGKPSPEEKCFIRAAFGEKFSLDHFMSVDEDSREDICTDAQERLQETMREVLPSELQFRFRFRPKSDDPGSIVIRTIDQDRGASPLTYRGTGAKKLYNLVLSILAFVSNKPGLILIDEPETSLHADAQRYLRRFLESVADQEGIQVVYTTHSSAMMNNLHPQTMRLIQRKKLTATNATSIVENKCADLNFKKVRSTLGVLPSDSLLYSDVCVIAEGVSECIALPIILEKLSQISAPIGEAFEAANSFHVVNGLGSGLVKLCTLAAAQGCRSIIFVDGDKNVQTLRSNIKTAELQTPVVALPQDNEIEDVLPIERYLEAVCDITGLDSGKCNAEAYRSFLSNSGDRIPARMMTSKKVNRWLNSEFNSDLDKPRVLLKAIELAKPNEFLFVPELEELARAVVSELSKL